MTWKQRNITSRRHPFAFGVYLLTLMLGVCFTFHIFGVLSFDGVREVYQIMWRAEMLSGGLMGIVSLVLPVKPYPNWPDLADCLRLESISSIVCGFGLLTYAVAISVAFDALGAGALLIGTLGMFCWFRGVQASRDSTYTQQMAALATQLQHSPLVETDARESYEQTIDHVALDDDVAGLHGHMTGEPSPEAEGDDAAVHRVEGRIEVVHKIERPEE